MIAMNTNALAAAEAEEARPSLKLNDATGRNDVAAAAADRDPIRTRRRTDSAESSSSTTTSTSMSSLTMSVIDTSGKLNRSKKNHRRCGGRMVVAASNPIGGDHPRQQQEQQQQQQQQPAQLHRPLNAPLMKELRQHQSFSCRPAGGGDNEERPPVTRSNSKGKKTATTAAATGRGAAATATEATTATAKQTIPQTLPLKKKKKSKRGVASQSGSFVATTTPQESFSFSKDEEDFSFPVSFDDSAAAVNAFAAASAPGTSGEVRRTPLEAGKKKKCARAREKSAAGRLQSSLACPPSPLSPSTSAKKDSSLLRRSAQQLPQPPSPTQQNREEAADSGGVRRSRSVRGTAGTISRSSSPRRGSPGKMGSWSANRGTGETSNNSNRNSARSAADQKQQRHTSPSRKRLPSKDKKETNSDGLRSKSPVREVSFNNQQPKRGSKEGSSSSSSSQSQRDSSARTGSSSSDQNTSRKSDKGKNTVADDVFNADEDPITASPGWKKMESIKNRPKSQFPSISNGEGKALKGEANGSQKKRSKSYSGSTASPAAAPSASKRSSSFSASVKRENCNQVEQQKTKQERASPPSDVDINCNNCMSSISCSQQEEEIGHGSDTALHQMPTVKQSLDLEPVQEGKTASPSKQCHVLTDVRRSALNREIRRSRNRLDTPNNILSKRRCLDPAQKKAVEKELVKRVRSDGVSPSPPFPSTTTDDAQNQFSELSSLNVNHKVATGEVFMQSRPSPNKALQNELLDRASPHEKKQEGRFMPRRPSPSTCKALQKELLERVSIHKKKQEIRPILRRPSSDDAPLPSAVKKELLERVSTHNSQKRTSFASADARRDAKGARKADSPQRPSRKSQKAALTKELMKQFSQKPSPLSPPKDQLDGKSLQNIDNVKSSIAALRPARRKITWNRALTDWERKSLNNTHISTLELGDLQIHGSNVRPGVERQNTMESDGGGGSADVVDDIRVNPAENLDILERNIRRCFRTIEKVQKETTSNNKKCDALRAENLKLRKQLMSTNTTLPRGAQSVRQSQNQLTAAIESLGEKSKTIDEQIGMLKMQRSKLKADSIILAEIAEATAAEQLLNASGDQLLKNLEDEGMSLAEESDILTILTCEIDVDDDDDLQRIFNPAPPPSASCRATTSLNLHGSRDYLSAATGSSRMNGSTDGVRAHRTTMFPSLLSSDRAQLSRASRVLELAADDVPPGGPTETEHIRTSPAAA